MLGRLPKLESDRGGVNICGQMETGQIIICKSSDSINKCFIRYTGDFGNGVKNGTGTLYFSNGDKRVGCQYPASNISSN